MAYRIDQEEEDSSIVIDGFENGIASSPYKGIANMRNVNHSYYPGVSYVNYKRLPATLGGGKFFAGVNSVNVSNNSGWLFSGSSGVTMGNPIQKAVSPSGLIYIQDSNGNIFKQNGVNGTTFNIIPNSGGRQGSGAAGLAWWNNYLVVFGGGLIEFCGDGTGDAGITSANWNSINTTGFGANGFTVTTNYASAPTFVSYTSPYTSNGTPRLNIGDPVTLTTTGTLPAPLVVGTTYYIAYKTISGYFYLSTTYANTAVATTATISAGATNAILNVIWQGTTGTYNIAFSDGTVRSTTLTNGTATFSWVTGLPSNVSAYISVCVTFTTDGTGVHTLTDNASPVPLGNITNFNVTFSVGSNFTGLTSFTITSYTDPSGITVNGRWQEASGIYFIIMKNGQSVPATFINGSTTVNLLANLTYLGYGTNWTVQLLNPSVTFYRPYISKVDGSLYFLNGQYIGRIQQSSDPNITFAPSLASTFNVSYGTFSIPAQYVDTAVDMVDLKSDMIVAGQKDTYVWNYVSPQTSAPSPVGEQIYSITNLLNNIYILAGQKGSVYLSNGYSSQFQYKLSDYIAGVIDPVWVFGGIMTHRSKLYFQALAKTVTGTNLLAGIFSLNISNPVIGETGQGLVMEAQNSYGLTPASGATGNGVLIENVSTNGYDSYYSAWSNGATTGGIDYNTNTLWGNYEPMIETDIIPLASLLQKKSLGNMEFKLDRPMVVGDSVRMSWRGSLTDSYSTPIVFNQATLSDYKQSDIAQLQWIQFKFEFACASSNSSYIPLREIRVHMA